MRKVLFIVAILVGPAVAPATAFARHGAHPHHAYRPHPHHYHHVDCPPGGYHYGHGYGYGYGAPSRYYYRPYYGPPLVYGYRAYPYYYPYSGFYYRGSGIAIGIGF